MSESVQLALIAAVPGFFVAITAFAIAINNMVHIERVKGTVDGIVTARVQAEHELGKAEGKLEQAQVPGTPHAASLT